MDGAQKSCPYCAELIRAEAVKCRWCGSRVEGGAFSRSWYRRREGKLLAGVCAGLAAEWGISVTIVRLAFLFTLPFGFWAVPLYLALWFIMPAAPARPPPAELAARRSGAATAIEERPRDDAHERRPYL